LAWFLRGANRRRCKKHAKVVLRNEGKGIRENVAPWTLQDKSLIE